MFGIDDDQIVRIDPFGGAPNAAHDRNIHGACDDRHVGSGRAVFENDALEFANTKIKQLGRTHVARDQNDLVRQGRVQHVGPALQPVDQAVRQIIHVRQARADVGSGTCSKRARV